MTLGLVTADDNGIYFAIDSIGLPAPSTIPARIEGLRNTLYTKVLQIQVDPSVGVLVAGGTQHWADVFSHYEKEDTLRAAANQIAELLGKYTSTENSAFSRICGYEAWVPKCYVIDRSTNQDFKAYENEWKKTIDTPTVLFSHRRCSVEEIGIPGIFTSQELQSLRDSIDQGGPTLQLIASHINRKFGHPDIREPVCVLSFPRTFPRPPDDGA